MSKFNTSIPHPILISPLLYRILDQPHIPEEEKNERPVQNQPRSVERYDRSTQGLSAGWDESLIDSTAVERRGVGELGVDRDDN